MKKILLIMLLCVVSMLMVTTVSANQTTFEPSIEASHITEDGFRVYITNNDDESVEMLITIYNVATQQIIFEMDYGYKLGSGATKGTALGGFIKGQDYIVYCQALADGKEVSSKVYSIIQLKK